MGKGTHRRSRAGAELVASEQGQGRSRRAGAELVTGEQGRMLVAGERRLVAGGRRAESNARGVTARGRNRAAGEGMRRDAGVRRARATG
jgi:hypothetical protein